MNSSVLSIAYPPGQTVEEMKEVYLHACEEYSRIFRKVAELHDDLSLMYGCFEKENAAGLYGAEYEYHSYAVLMKQYNEKRKSLDHMARVKEAFKQRYRSMKKEAKRAAHKAQPQVVEPDIIDLTQDEVVDYMESRFPVSISLPCLIGIVQAHKLFRHFKMNVDGTCSFQIAKDGACYENMRLPCVKSYKDITIATLRIYATALQLKGRGSMDKCALITILTPIMDEITTYSAW